MFIFSVASRKVTRLLLPRAHKTVQKNWVPLWFEGALHFLLYANPRTVLQCDPPKAACASAAILSWETTASPLLPIKLAPFVLGPLLPN